MSSSLPSSLKKFNRFELALGTLKNIRSIGQILPAFLAILTGCPRYLPTIEWSSQSFVHNLFRGYELVFWRKYGIRPELSSARDVCGRITYVYHSFEAILAGVETEIRSWLQFKIRLPIKVWIPLMATPAGFKVPASPYLFAIAFNASSQSDQQSSSSSSWTHTVTGSNPLLAMGNWSGGDVTTGATYATVAMSQAVKINSYLNSDESYLWYLPGAATGANTVLVSLSGTVNNAEQATSFSGCAQTGQPDGTPFSNPGDAASSTFSMTLTTLVDNSWLFGTWRSLDAGCSAGSNTIVRSNNGLTIGDSNSAQTPAGSHALNLTGCGNRVSNKLMTAFSPAGTTPAGGSTPVPTLLLMNVG